MVIRYSLALRTPPICRLGPIPKKQLDRERDNNNNNNKYKGHKYLSQGLATPLISTYIFVVEVTTKAGVSSTSFASPKQPQIST
jgi:hypothetical protein